MERQRKPRVNLIGYKNSHGIVEELGPPGKFKIRCKHCNELHIQSSREIQRDSRPFKCKNFKPHNWSGLDRWDAIIRREYGITLEEYYKLIEFQGGGCYICGRKQEPDGRKLSIDHDHSNGKVRGVLCYACNKALGLFYDKPERLRKAAEYLENPPKNIMESLLS